MKTLRPIFAVIAMSAILCGTSAHLQAGDGERPLYIALFRLTVGSDSKLQDFQAVKVIDLLSGSNNLASIELPPAFIEQAKKKVGEQHLVPTVQDGKPSSIMTALVYSPTDEKNEPGAISFSSLNGAMSTIGKIQLLGQGGELTTFGTDLQSSAFFVGYYALPGLPKASSEQRQAIVEAEIQRSAANLPNVEITSRKDMSTASQTIMEATCKSSRNKAMTFRTRYLCNDRQLLALTTITPEGLPAGDVQSFERLFEAFRFP